jgi:hypothetical protein
MIALTLRRSPRATAASGKPGIGVGSMMMVMLCVSEFPEESYTVTSSGYEPTARAPIAVMLMLVAEALVKLKLVVSDMVQ